MKTFRSGLGEGELSYGVQIVCNLILRDGSSKTTQGHALPLSARELEDTAKKMHNWSYYGDHDFSTTRESLKRLFSGLLSFVTCRHLVELPVDKYGHSIPEEITISVPARSATYKATLARPSFKIWVPSNPRLDLAIITANAESLESWIVSLESLPDKGLNVVAPDVIGRFAEPAFGPEWGQKIGFVSKQAWASTPILRTGIVSSNPKTEFSSSEIGKDDILLLEAQSFAGSSGAPVWSYPLGSPISEAISFNPPARIEPYKPAILVGIMSGHIQNKIAESGAFHDQHVGLSFCHRTEVIFRILMGREPIEPIKNL